MYQVSFPRRTDVLWQQSGWENLCTIAQYRECDEIIGEPFWRGIYLTITSITGAVQTIDTMGGWRYKISATIFCTSWGSQGLRVHNLTVQFLWHSCPLLLSSPVFIRWSNIKWFFCCLSWGIFKKLATDPLQMPHRGNETNIKMLVYIKSSI